MSKSSRIDNVVDREFDKQFEKENINGSISNSSSKSSISDMMGEYELPPTAAGNLMPPETPGKDGGSKNDNNDNNDNNDSNAENNLTPLPPPPTRKDLEISRALSDVKNTELTSAVNDITGLKEFEMY